MNDSSSRIASYREPENEPGWEKHSAILPIDSFSSSLRPIRVPNRFVLGRRLEIFDEGSKSLIVFERDGGEDALMEGTISGLLKFC